MPEFDRNAAAECRCPGGPRGSQHNVWCPSHPAYRPNVPTQTPASCADCGSTAPVGFTGRFERSGKCRDTINCRDRMVAALRAELAGAKQAVAASEATIERAEAEVERLTRERDDAIELYLAERVHTDGCCDGAGPYATLVCMADRLATSEQEAHILGRGPDDCGGCSSHKSHCCCDELTGTTSEQGASDA